jgi:hypothetical protein
LKQAVRGRQLAGGRRAWLVLEGLLGVGAGIVLLGLAVRLRGLGRRLTTGVAGGPS